MIPVHNEDSPVPARSFCKTDWTKPKFVTKPYCEVRQKSTPETRDGNPAGLGALGADLNYDAGCKVSANQAPNPDVMLSSATHNEELKSNAASIYSMYPSVTYDGLKLHVTTGSSNYDEEKLVQKIEDIEEVPLVEAEPRTDIIKAQQTLGPSVMPVTHSDISWQRTKKQFIDELSICLLSSMNQFDKLLMRHSNYQNRDIKIDTIVQIKNVSDLFNEFGGKLINKDEGTANQCFTKESAPPEVELQPEDTLETNQASKDKKMPITKSADGESFDADTKPNHVKERFYEEESYLIINNAKGRISDDDYPLPSEFPRCEHEYKMPKIESNSEKSANENEATSITQNTDMIKEFKMLDDYKQWLFKPLLLLNNMHLSLVYDAMHNLTNQIVSPTLSVFQYPTAAMSTFLLMSDNNRNARFNLEDSTLIVNNFRPKMREGYQLPNFKPKPKKRIKRLELKNPKRSNMQFKFVTLEEQKFYDGQPSLDDPISTYEVISSVSLSSLLQRVGVQNHVMFSNNRVLQDKKKSHCSPPSPHFYPSKGTVTGTPSENPKPPMEFPKVPIKPATTKKKKCQDTRIDNPVTLPQMGASLLPPNTLPLLLLFNSDPKVVQFVSNIRNARAGLTHMIDGLLGFSSSEGNVPMDAMEMLG